ncbi:MAG: prepilin-type N-terminal cleavage/methylation domain-containing protein [Arenicella sp.]|jgi:type IV pilus assembly protein PilW
MKIVNKDINAQRGFTLVELMVGLVLSVFIIGIAITYMVTSAMTFRVQTNEALIQENARFALEVLTQNFRLAGLNPSNKFDNNLDVIYSGAKCSANESSIADNAAGNTACTKDGANNTTDNNSDRIAVDYVIDATKSTVAVVVDGCNSHKITVNAGAEARLASVFWSADIDGDLVRSLYCQTFNLDTETAEGVALPLIDGVDRVQFQYGVDSDNDGVVERYQSFTNLGAANSGNVRSIRISILLNGGASRDRNLDSEVKEIRKYTLLDAPFSSFDDRELRQVYSTTVLIPNTLNKL